MGLKLGSLFDGSGGFPLAGALAGVEPVWASEIEPFPIKVTSARFPHMKHVGDITKLNGSELDPVDIITFGSPCFPKGSLVNTIDGYKRIEDITIFDKVLTHTGKYKQVLNHAYTGNKKLWEISTMSCGPIKATGNHPFYIRTRYREYHHTNSLRLFSAPKFKELSELTKDDYVGMPIDTRSSNPLKITDEEAWLIGRYIADGYLKKGQRSNRPEGSCFNDVIFCVGSGKESVFEDHLRHLQKYGKSKSVKNVIKYTICSNRLCTLCASCGEGAENKCFPSWAIALPVDLLKLMIDGYISGDGSSSDGNKYKLTTVSSLLAYSITAAVAKVYHRPCGVYFTKRPPTHVIEGRTVNQKDSYQVIWKISTDKQDKAFYEDGYIWSPIRYITKTNICEPVYDITVEEDHSFCVCNIAVHNCQDLSVAGRRAGIIEGERSNLFFEAVRIVKEMREATNGEYPKWLIWENVVGALSSNKGEDFKVVLDSFCSIKGGDVDIPMSKGKWSKAGLIVGYGYSVAWRVMDAQYWGVPQRRRRLFAVVHLTDGTPDVGEILFKPESLQGNIAESEGAWERAAPFIARSTP